VVAWKLPLVVVAIAVPIAAAFYAGGPGVGVAVGALAAVAIVVAAVRERPRGAIGAAAAEDGRRRLLVVVSRPVEDPATIAEIVAATGSEGAAGPAPADVMVLAPARIGFLERWASDLERARAGAQRNLVLTVASLAKAGVGAEARVGDEDLVQAVEDQIGSFRATEVILVTAADEDDPAAAAAAAELGSRLRVPFRRLFVSARAAG
jgi:hypothetical protein